jgi:hypothetical protein
VPVARLTPKAANPTHALEELAVQVVKPNGMVRQVSCPEPIPNNDGLAAVSRWPPAKLDAGPDAVSSRQPLVSALKNERTVKPVVMARRAGNAYAMDLAKSTGGSTETWYKLHHQVSCAFCGNLSSSTAWRRNSG